MADDVLRQGVRGISEIITVSAGDVRCPIIGSVSCQTTPLPPSFQSLDSLEFLSGLAGAPRACAHQHTPSAPNFNPPRGMQVPGLVNVDFADVRAIMAGAGSSLMGQGIASGPERAKQVGARASRKVPGYCIVDLSVPSRWVPGQAGRCRGIA
eukprot:1149776-Pelagomonas_calceolata.AAC.3